MEKIILSTDDDITEITQFSDQERVRVRVINKELKQSCWFNGEQRMFTLFNGDQCYQKVSGTSRPKIKHRVNLGFLDESPVKQVKYAYKWFLLAALLFVLSVMLISGHLVENRNFELLVESMAALSFLMGLMALFTGWMQSSSRLVFYSRHARVPLLEFIRHSPSRNTFNEFIETLQQKIIDANKKDTSNLEQYLARELKELRRLKSEGVIQTTEFNQAMKFIVDQSGFNFVE